MASEGKPGKEESRGSKLAHAVVAGVFLIGLAVLFYFDLFWPWIMALVGVVVILEALLSGKR